MQDPRTTWPYGHDSGASALVASRGWKAGSVPIAVFPSPMGTRQSTQLSAPEAPEPSIKIDQLPLDALQAVCCYLELSERFNLTCCNRALRSLESELVPLKDVWVELRDLRCALSWAAFLHSRTGRLRCLHMQLPPQELFIEDPAPEAVQTAPWLWHALAGASSLERLTWDALAHEGPFPAPQLAVGFAYQPLELRNLQQLALRAPAVSLPTSFSCLSRLTELQVAGYCLRLARGCLPPDLLSLSVEWLPTMTPVTTQPEHLAMLAEAAAAAPCIGRLRLLGAMSSEGLGSFRAMTSLEWSLGYLPSLQGARMLPRLQELALAQLQINDDLAALTGLRQLSRLSLAEVSLGRDWPEVLRGVWELPALEDLTLSNCWCEGQELLLPVLPLPPNRLISLAMDVRSLCTDGSMEALEGLKHLEELALLHGALPTWGAVGYSVPQERLAALLHVAGDVLPQLRRVEVRPFGARQSSGQPWLAEAVLAELEGLKRRDPAMELLF